MSSKRAFSAIAPGRVNLLGEHVDYNDGVVLPAAIDRSVTVSADVRDDRLLRLIALDLNEETTFSLDHLAEKVDVNGAPLPAWALYPAGVASVLLSRGLKVTGLDAEFTSNVPMGSGLSSSAAVELAFATLWRATGGWQAGQMTLARVSQEAENKYVGVNCGLMDQFASAHGVQGHAMALDTRTLEWCAVPLPAGAAIVIADSKVRRSLATSAYNERRASCEAAVAALKTVLPHITALRDVTPAQFEEHKALLEPTVAKRAKHIVYECARVDEALELLRAGDYPAFGQLMYQGHASLRDDYEVSCPELDKLVELASGLPGCVGARLTGAGFGGCTVNLVREADVPAFVEGLKAGYLQATGKQADVYVCRASQGARAFKNA